MLNQIKHFLHKQSILTLLFFTLLTACSSTGINEEISSVNSNKTLSINLLFDSIELIIGDDFDPYEYVDASIINQLSVSSNVDINQVGEYQVVYSSSNDEKTLLVKVIEEPILLSIDELSLDYGSVFDPRAYINNDPNINIINPVNTRLAGTYTVSYSIDNFEKQLIVHINEAKLDMDSDWLVDQLSHLDLLEHRLIEVDKCDLSGGREANVVVDIGYGDREYYAFTNDYGQLTVVLAEHITRQDESTEVLLGEGRYCRDEANVEGTEDPDLDQGHVIADSLGGVANAYNITPQNSNLNRFGDQAYMESSIRSALAVTQFIAIITYPNTQTQIPSHYNFSYIINGHLTTDEFDNVNPNPVTTANNSEISDTNDISSIDTNHNGTITIAEAKAAGFSMPIHSDHWLYPYMIDGDNDGMVGE